MGPPSGQTRAYVRLTDPAVEDMERLLAKDPQIVRWALQKMLLLERNPQAGEPLLGGLIGWRKLTVGNRDWRIVWRVSEDSAGAVTITIAEVWAVGARSDAEVYDEMTTRIADLSDGPETRALRSVVQLLGRHVDRPELHRTAEPVHDPVPSWLQVRLVHTAKLSVDEVESMTGEAAMARWEQFLRRGK